VRKRPTANRPWDLLGGRTERTKTTSPLGGGPTGERADVVMVKRNGKISTWGLLGEQLENKVQKPGLPTKKKPGRIDKAQDSLQRKPGKKRGRVKMQGRKITHISQSRTHNIRDLSGVREKKNWKLKKENTKRVSRVKKS